MENILERLQKEIDYILEHEDGLSKDDKNDLHRLLQEKKKHEQALNKIELGLQKIIDETENHV